MSCLGWIILVILNIPLYIAFGWVFFGTWDGFWEGIKFWGTPNIISAFRGEYWEDRWAEIKLFLWGAFCVGFVLAEAYILSKFLG